MSHMIKTVGLELEGSLHCQGGGYNAAITEVARLVTAGGVPCQVAGIRTSTFGTWKTTSDGSVRGTRSADYPFELVSRVLHTDLDWAEEVRMALGNIIDGGVSVNQSTGFHVHLGAAHLPLPVLKTIIRRWSAFEAIFDSLQPNDRRANGYCRSNVLTDTLSRKLERATCLEDLAVLFGHQPDDRYRRLNLQPLTMCHNSDRPLGTIEVRLAAGTFDPEKVINWVRLLLSFVDECGRQAGLPVAGSSPVAAPVAADFPVNSYNGKKRQVIDALLSADGLNSQYFQGSLGWLPHTLRGMLSHLRRDDFEPRGYTFSTYRVAGVTVYKAVRVAGLPVAVAEVRDTLWAGIPTKVETFWKNRQRFFASASLRQAA